MPQKTNLNINPYYDDFNKDDNYYRVLFKPGRPVQARELTGLQSILQNQIESFGSHIFKEGSMVIPGGVTCDNAFTTVKVNKDHLGIDVTVYLDAITNYNNGRGTKVKGVKSGVVGTLKGYLLPPEEGVEDITLFVKYVDGGNDGQTSQFSDGEILTLEENITYGNTSLNIGDSVLTLVSIDATKTGYAVGVSKGVYFIRGVFVDVPNTQIVLDPYNNEPSYRVGFDVLEEIVTSNDDPDLNDNARGFTNFAAPGADRLKISVKLAKKQLTDFDDVNFIELVKVDQGKIKKLQNKSEYSIIKEYFAKRTFEESGNYALKPFTVSVANSLNNETGNGGLYREGQRTEQGNLPNDNLMSVTVSSGTAYVKGFDIDLVGTTVVDVEKPRSVKTVDGALVPFAMGSLLKVNNVYGVPYINIGASSSGAQTTQANIIELYNRRRDGAGTGGTVANASGLGTKIGEARVYWYGVADAPYTANNTEWDLYLFDVQTYTTLYLGRSYTTTEVPLTSFVRGLSSGATGYLAAKPNGAAFSLSQTSGTFLVGEQIIINENPELKVGVSAINVYTTEDIKSVYQDASTISGLSVDFLADTVLYERTPPNFAITDKLRITSSTGVSRAPGRFFSGATGIKTESIIKYQEGTNTDPTFNRIASINTTGTEITLAATGAAVAGVCDNGIAAADTESVFSLMEPKIVNLVSSGLYTNLPRPNIASVDLSSSELTISRQVTGKSTDANGQLTLTTSDVLDVSAGISSVFFESFDAERYSVHYSDGTTDQLTASKFTRSIDGSSITFTKLTANQTNNVTVNVTLKKRAVTNKSKDFIRSRQVSITRTSGISTQSGPTSSGLSTSKYYGLRVEDAEICLNVPDVVNIRAVYESTNTSAPVLDKLVFASGLNLDNNVIVGEKIVGEDSRAVAQVVTKTSTTVEFVYLNQNNFKVGELVKFNESSLNIAIQSITEGSYIDKTSNYVLDKGHKDQYCDYSKIRRRAGSALPARQLLVIFDYYKVASGNNGDIFTVNSYTEDRYSSDIPSVPDGTRVSDMIDFRPRVVEFDPATATTSPFAFSSRSYESTYRYVISPDETSFVGYSYYLPRVDLVTVNRFGEVEIVKGESSDTPRAPILADDAMELAQISYPPYLFNPRKDPRILLRDNRRFTMRDIAKLEERIENLEEVTSLSMLELKAQTLEVLDANGNNRFKSGFIVSSFKDKSLCDQRYSTIDVSASEALGIAPIDFWSLQAELALDPAIDKTTADLTQNLKLLDPNIQKTGDLLTLKYEEVGWIEQPHATTVENVNPFNVIVFVGGVVLDPASDNWVRTIYIDDQRIESTGAEWKQQAKTKVDVDTKTEKETYKKGGNRSEKGVRNVTTTTTTTTTKYKPVLKGPSREFDYVEDVKISGTVDPFMRSRNVYFAANGLKPFTKHYHYLDSQEVDIIPKLCEIEMQSGTFQIYENARIYLAGKQIGYIRIQKPKHKFGDTGRPDIGAGLGSLSVLVEEYSVDPYDRTRPGPGDAYSATSKLINFGVRVLATEPEKYYGYVAEGATVVGETSGATARIIRAELISDNWGDVIGNFFFRDPNTNPPPPVRVTSGTKTVKITAVPPGVTPLPGSTVFASEAIGTYSGSGTILTQETSRVSVRNPPKPAALPTDVKVEVKAPHRDPLAQSFTVDGKGAFLTSFDLYFATKDPSAKIYVELRTVELGTPTQFLVQDYTQVALNPNDINIAEDSFEVKSMAGFDDAASGFTPGRFGYEQDYPYAKSLGFSDADIRYFLENVYKGVIGPKMQDVLKDPNWGRYKRKSMVGFDDAASGFTPGQFGYEQDYPYARSLGFSDADIRYFLENEYNGIIGPKMQDVLKDSNWGRYERPRIPEPVPTRVRFPSPVYLEAGKEYAIVILSPASDGYEMWTATMGEKTVKTKNLPDVQNVVVTKQYIGGSLFKSQNGTIWTASQYQDLTFKLYKAKFVPSGTLTFYNTDINTFGTNVSTLQNNPIEGLPRKLMIPITGTLNAAVVPGTKIGQGSSPSVTGIVENLGGPVGVVTVISGGSGYPASGTTNNVPLYSISGKGTGATANVTVSNGKVISVTPTATTGSGYVNGEILGITTSNIGSGSGARVSVASRGAANTIYLTGVQGENFTNTSSIVYYTNPTNESSRTTSGATVSANSTLIDDKFSGNVFRIKQYNHAHHGGNNVIEVKDVLPDRENIQLTVPVGLNDTVVSVANTTVFARFEGITTSRGYALINNEVVSYSGITQTSGDSGTLIIDGRGLNGSAKVAHTIGFVTPYEVNGVSLMRINKTHNIPATYYNLENSNLDNYFLEFDRTTPTVRSTGTSMLNFESQKGFGGNSVKISQNHQFSSIEPIFNIITPGKGTAVSSQIRTISGTSAGGTEVSFLDLGYEPIQLNRVTHFPTPRLVASKVNENARLTTLPSNKSLTLRVDFVTEDENLSPVMDLQNSTFILGRNRVNKPISDYVLDSRTNEINGDPHGAVFVTQIISLAQPATSLKVLVAANRQPEADIRAFYRLFKADSSDVPQSYVPFPGYDNLSDTDGDGFGDLILDLSANSGRPDAFVNPDGPESFSEYQFSVNNLEQFNGFSIKIVMSSTNESTPVKLKDFRCIALA